MVTRVQERLNFTVWHVVQSEKPGVESFREHTRTVADLSAPSDARTMRSSPQYPIMSISENCDTKSRIPLQYGIFFFFSRQPIPRYSLVLYLSASIFFLRMYNKMVLSKTATSCWVALSHWNNIKINGVERMGLMRWQHVDMPLCILCPLLLRIEIRQFTILAQILLNIRTNGSATEY